jgi:hypothetical protein
MFWPPQDTTGWELVPGPDSCRCGTSACRSGWDWRPVAAPSEAAQAEQVREHQAAQAADPSLEPEAGA